MGVPGPVLSSGYVKVCVNLGWKECYPARELSEILEGMPVKLGNDANVAALGETWAGGAKGIFRCYDDYTWNRSWRWSCYRR